MAAILEGKRGGGPASYPCFEVDMMDNPLLALSGPTCPLANGTIAIPDGPGIGLALKPDRLSPWMTDHWSVTL